MTVSELVAELQKLDQNLPVVTRGIQTGFEDAYASVVMSVFEHPDGSWTRSKYSPFKVKNTKPVTIVFIG